MIGIIFQFGNEYVEVRIDRSSIYFRSQTYGNNFVPFENLRLDYNGVVKEFPDLRDREDWRVVAVSRFKEKIANMKSEKEIADYIIDDLSKFGYVPKYRQIKGFRVEKLS